MALVLTIAARRGSAPPAPGARPAPAKEATMTMRLTSPAFADGAEIPREHTADGRDVSPPLAWSGAPAGTRSLALIVDDPDAPDPAAPRVVWVHWVVVDLPPGTTALAAGASPRGLPAGAREGLNDWKQPGWRGPSPPIGRHRYVHTLYALDATLAGLRAPTKAQLLEAMKGHVLAEARLTGTYARR
jgi:Raf kinase inhibitor-like YbhB/YbcL family protein